MMTYQASAVADRASALEATISTVAFGPCWCRSVPGSDGSFDVFRQRSVKAPLERNVLVVSNRVPPSGVPTVRRLHHGLNDPIVVATNACPTAGWYWDASPSGWIGLAELLEVDHEVDACLTGQPERLFGALLTIRDTLKAHRLTALTEAG